MSAQKRYKSAPITEAVIEIRVAAPAASNQPALERLRESLKKDFPKQAPMQFPEMGVEHKVGGPLQQSVVQSVVGLRLANQDDSRVLQIRHDGLAFSHLAPYSDWTTFRREARPLWDLYRATCPDARLTRCALLYINRIDLPGTSVEPEDYFGLYLQIPDEIPQHDVIAMTMMVQMPQHDLECVANIRQRLLKPIKEEHVYFLSDIDIYRLNIEDWDDDTAWSFLDRLRDRKNEIFEACITNRTRELIDQ